MDMLWNSFTLSSNCRSSWSSSLRQVCNGAWVFSFRWRFAIKPIFWHSLTCIYIFSIGVFGVHHSLGFRSLVCARMRHRTSIYFSLRRCMFMLRLRCVILMKLFSKFPFLVLRALSSHVSCGCQVSCYLTILLSLDLFWHSNLFSNWVFGVLELLSMCKNATSSANLFSLCRIMFMLGV